MPTLHWIGKDKVINHHQDVPYKILEKQYTYANGEQATEGVSENKIIHGDNLEALKSLLPEYEGKVKCIYIDPPYNTGNEGWVYNDNVNDPKIKKWLHQVVGKEGEDLTRHDKWLCMMYPRVKLINKLLHSDGSFIISLSHHELSSFILLCKEIFADRQIVTITVQTSGGKPSGGFNYVHEYLILIVPKNFTPNPLSFSGGKSRSPFEGLTLATFNKEQRPNQAYPIFINKNTGVIEGVGKSLQQRVKDGQYQGELKDFSYNIEEAPENCVSIWPVTSKGQECVWRLIPKRLLEDWDKGYIKVSKNNSLNNNNLFSVQYLPSGVLKKIESGILEVVKTDSTIPTLEFGENRTEGGQIPTIWMEKSFHTVAGTTLIKDIFNEKAFNYPKPLGLIEDVLRACTNEDDIILDSFAGSGTTAHSVLNLNKQDGGNRKFILIEMEEYAETITAERVKRAINGYGEGAKAVEGTGGDFTYYTLGAPVFLEDGFLNEAIGADKICEYVWYSETRSKYTAQDEPYLLGKKEDTAYYFYYERDNATTLDENFLRKLRTKAGQYIIYADNCLLDDILMQKYHIVFKKIPRDITRF